MEKIRKYGVMAIVLPSLTKKHNEPIVPIEVGDRLPHTFTERLIKSFPENWSSSSFSKKRITVIIQGQETLLANFHLPEEFSFITDRMHTCILSNTLVNDCKFLLSSDNEITPIKIPVSTDSQWNMLFVSSRLPHLVLIDAKGMIASIHFGQYLSGSNIRELSHFVDEKLFAQAEALLSSPPNSPIN